MSATLGKDSLRAGLLAGGIGLVLVLLYMILYYRALGLVVVLGLGVSGMLLYSIISELSQSSGLALSLAGATGIIVSVGVTVDSYIVYFERLKDEIRSGKTVRSSVDRGFSRAFRTILAADLVSILAAAILYLFTVGSVRGFAFFLGLSTLLDLITAYSFTRPMVVLLGRNRTFTEARFLGVARGLAAEPDGRRGMSDDPAHHLATACTTARPRSTSSAAAAGGSSSRARSSSSGWSSLLVRGLNFGIDFKGGTVWEVPTASASVAHVRDVIGGGVARPPPGQDRDPDRPRRPGSTDVRVSAEASTTKDKTKVTDVTDALAKMANTPGQRRHPQRRRRLLGQRHHQQGGAGPVIFLVAVFVYITFRFERKMAIAAMVAADPRHPGHGRDLFAVGVPGHAGHGHRLPDHPRVLALRHHRRVRQGRGEHQGPGLDRPDDLHRHGQPVHEPGADAVDQHLARRHHADPVDPGHRRRCSSARPPSRTSAWPCSSACSPGPTRRSSSPRRSWPCSRSASRATP